MSNNECPTSKGIHFFIGYFLLDIRYSLLAILLFTTAIARALVLKLL
jgi:hypothetical protein